MVPERRFFATHATAGQLRLALAPAMPHRPRGVAGQPGRNRSLLAGWRKIPYTAPARRWYLHGGCRAERDAEDVVDPGFKGRHARVGALFRGPRNGRRERNMSKNFRTLSPDDAERGQELFR